MPRILNHVILIDLSNQSILFVYLFFKSSSITPSKARPKAHFRVLTRARADGVSHTSTGRVLESSYLFRKAFSNSCLYKNEPKKKKKNFREKMSQFGLERSKPSSIFLIELWLDSTLTKNVRSVFTRATKFDLARLIYIHRLKRRL